MRYSAEDFIEVNQQIALLEAKRTEIMQKLGLLSQKKGCHLKLDGNVLKLYEFILLNPGTNRREIRSLFPNLSDYQLAELITTLRRAYGLIENRGYTNLGSWYVVRFENSDQETS